MFTPVFGGTKRLNNISIDLIASDVVDEEADTIAPANRLDVSGLPVFDYLVYPVASAIADKVCATMKQYSNGRSSSRVRDLVDLVVYLTTQSFEGGKLRSKIECERRLRRMPVFDSFCIPKEWPTRYSRSYKKSAKEAKLADAYLDIQSAETFVKRCIDPVIAGAVDEMAWSPSDLSWTQRE